MPGKLGVVFEQSEAPWMGAVNDALVEKPCSLHREGALQRHGVAEVEPRQPGADGLGVVRYATWKANRGLLRMRVR